jgi:hypothetical protein
VYKKNPCQILIIRRFRSINFNLFRPSYWLAERGRFMDENRQGRFLINA